MKNITSFLADDPAADQWAPEEVRQAVMSSGKDHLSAQKLTMKNLTLLTLTKIILGTCAKVKLLETKNAYYECHHY